MYQCKVENDLGTAFSSGQLKIVSFPPTFAKSSTEKLRKVFVKERENVTIPCNPESAPDPEFVWRKNGDKIASGGKYIIHQNGDLFVKNVNFADSGTYTCEAFNDLGNAKEESELLVSEHPTFDGGVKPEPEIVSTYGDHIQFECQAGYSPDPEADIAYSWTLNGLPVVMDEITPAEQTSSITFQSMSDFERLLVTSPWHKHYLNPRRSSNKFWRGSLDEDGTLRVSNLSYSENGIFKCEIASVSGSVNAKSEVKIHGPPGLNKCTKF